MALYWICAGRAYDVTSGEIRSAFDLTLRAAEIAQCTETALKQIRNLLERFPQEHLVKGALANAKKLWSVG